MPFELLGTISESHTPIRALQGHGNCDSVNYSELQNIVQPLL